MMNSINILSNDNNFKKYKEQQYHIIFKVSDEYMLLKEISHSPNIVNCISIDKSKQFLHHRH